MRKDLERIRKRHKKRQTLRKQHVRLTPSSHASFNQNERTHPLFSKEKFLIKVLLSAGIFLSVAILFKQPADQFSNLRRFITYTFEQDFQFASVASWYEQTFGKPLALLPEKLNRDEAEKDSPSRQHYAVPVTGKIVEPFDVQKKGILLETGVDATIECIQDGFVVFVGEKDNLHQTVIVQHNDGSESWYGNLESVHVKLYDYIKSGDAIGKALKGSDGKNGIFFFAIKQGESFIDPIQVMSFD